MNNINTKYYLKNLDDNETLVFLNKLKQAHSQAITQFQPPIEIYLWEKESTKIDTYTIEQFDKKISDKIYLTPLKITSDTQFTNSFSKEVLIKAQIEKTQYFSNTTLNFTKIDYAIRFNNPIFKGVQRANCRLTADDKLIKLWFELDQKKFQGNDISAGGASFWLPLEDSKQFATNQILDQIKIGLNNIVYQIPMAKIICNVKSDFVDKNGNSYNKLAIEFLDLPLSTDEQLYRQINSEMRSLAIRSGL